MNAAALTPPADSVRAHYRPDIDGLRAVAVGVVVAYHAFPLALPGGFVGVDVFFVISGYLISGIILNGIGAGGFSFTHFYARRIRRIFPALVSVLASVMAAGWFLLYADDYQRLGRHVAAGAAFSSNFVLWQESSYFDTAADLKPLLHLWSLGIEEQFYLVWPLLLVMASRTRRGPLLLTLALGALSFLVAIYTVRIDRTPAFFAPWTRFWELLAGAVLACVEFEGASLDRVKRLLSSQANNRLAIIGATMIAAGVVLIDATRVFPGLWVLLPVGGTFLLLLTERAWINRVVLSQPVMVGVGLISYPLYLWHWPLLSFARITGGEEPSAALRWLLVAVSVLLAWLTYLAIERPIRFGPRTRRMVPALSAAMVLLCAAGIATHAAGGVIDRPINRSDAARLVDYYERMRKTGLREAYRAECDFMDWTTEATKSQIDPSCTTGGTAGTVLLWGDSFAQSLSLGLREQLPNGVALAQIATSACGVAIDNFDLSVRDRRCERTNQHAMEAIRRLRPQLVILAQSGGHAVIEYERIAAKAIELGAGHILVVGPFPIWRPGLPRLFSERHLRDRPEFVGEGLNQEVFAADRQLATKLGEAPNITYVSLLDRLCRNSACLARVPGEDALDLMALDFGHLTPKGSEYVGGAVFKPYLERVQWR